MHIIILSDYRERGALTALFGPADAA